MAGRPAIPVLGKDLGNKDTVSAYLRAVAAGLGTALLEAVQNTRAVTPEPAKGTDKTKTKAKGDGKAKVEGEVKLADDDEVELLGERPWYSTLVPTQRWLRGNTDQPESDDAHIARYVLWEAMLACYAEHKYLEKSVREGDIQALHKKFEGLGQAAVLDQSFDLMVELIALRIQDGETSSAFAHRFSELWAKLTNAVTLSGGPRAAGFFPRGPLVVKAFLRAVQGDTRCAAASMVLRAKVREDPATPVEKLVELFVEEGMASMAPVPAAMRADLRPLVPRAEPQPRPPRNPNKCCWNYQEGLPCAYDHCHFRHVDKLPAGTCAKCKKTGHSWPTCSGRQNRGLGAHVAQAPGSYGSVEDGEVWTSGLVPGAQPPL